VPRQIKRAAGATPTSQIKALARRAQQRPLQGACDAGLDCGGRRALIDCLCRPKKLIDQRAPLRTALLKREAPASRL
jgi:hypothetical protein